jgi:lantibiotic modifying enzyme
MARPAVRFAWQELVRAVPEEQFRNLSGSTTRRLRDSLLGRLAGSARAVTEWESKTNGVHALFGDGADSAMTATLWRYPALARLWAQQINNWTSFVTEFLAHADSFLRDRSKLQSNRVRISSLDPDLSDLHHRNRSVFRVGLTDGTIWFFKPRSGEQEAGWFALLSSLNCQGFSHQFKIPRLIRSEDAFWMEAILRHPCRNRAEACCYFFRAGALLYLAHLLKGVDLHAGNIVAHRSDPVFVDCETLLHPRIRVPPFARKQQRGVLRTGLLPVEPSNDSVRDNVSGYGRCAAGAHRVGIRCRPAFARDFVDEVIAGFSAMHAFLTSDKGKGFSEMAARHLPKVGRRIYRPTSYYEAILDRSLGPRLMINGFERSLFLQAALRSDLAPSRHLQSEVAALEAADTPHLMGKVTQPHEPLDIAATRESLILIRNSFANHEGDSHAR